MRQKLMLFTIFIVFAFGIDIQVFAETNSKIIRVIPPFTEFPDVWEFGEGEIINKANIDQVSPGDPLEYQVTITNPKQEDRVLSVSFRIFANGEWQNPIDLQWTILANSTKNIVIPFVLNAGGTNDLQIQFIFDRQIHGSVHPNHTFYVKDIHVLTVGDKALESIVPWSPIIQIALVATTIALVIVTYLNMRKTSRLTDQQLALTRRELESRLKADLTVSVGDSNLKKDGEKWVGTVKIIIRNEGQISARHIKVHFKDPDSSLGLDQLIRDEEKIKKIYFQIPGSIPSKSHYPEHILHNTVLDESKPYDLAVWVTYDYANLKNMEFIQIVKINAQSNSDGPLYEQEDIENEKKMLKELGM